MRKGEGSLALLVAAVWLIALCLGGLLLLGVRFDPSPGAPPAAAQPPLPTDTVAGPEATTTTLSTQEVSRPTGSLKVAAAGDVIGARQVGVFIDANGGEAVFAAVREPFREADLAFVNLESPLSDKGRANKAKDVTFRGRPALVAGLRSASIDAVSLANNHALDWGEEALADTLSRLSAAGIAAAGAGVDLAEARRPAVVDTPSGTAALLAFSNVLPAGFPAGDSKAGVNPARPDRARLLSDIQAAGREHDWVIVSFHWGIEYEARAAAEQRELAHAAIDAGADLILGHHPHVIQGLELYGDKLIAYSLGDFVFDHYSRETGEAFILEVELKPEGAPAVTARPVYLDDVYGIPKPVTGDAADRILSRLDDISSALGMVLERQGDLLVSGF